MGPIQGPYKGPHLTSADRDPNAQWSRYTPLRPRDRAEVPKLTVPPDLPTARHLESELSRAAGNPLEGSTSAVQNPYVFMLKSEALEAVKFFYGVFGLLSARGIDICEKHPMVG